MNKQANRVKLGIQLRNGQYLLVSQLPIYHIMLLNQIKQGYLSTWELEGWKFNTKDVKSVGIIGQFNNEGM